MKHYDIIVCGGGIAGVAAAMSSELNLFPAAIPVSALQYELRKTGGVMHIDNGYPLKNKGNE